ncbi:hypothetical protein [Homoserinimonas sp. OAct 916]|uniref:hypothetical protein n=1 Tax=Homoserinimonas sp. OAct 916 TaxID=2211450 RepID=UPI0018E574CF|nr:hypothetical protein [Homoserinimonas sp. OAct 916]
MAFDQRSARLHTTVGSARAAGATWQSIGATLGMTKQAAQKRFAPPAAVPAAHDPNERTIGPTTSFDEMQELALAGQYGWHAWSSAPPITASSIRTHSGSIVG